MRNVKIERKYKREIEWEKDGRGANTDTKKKTATDESLI